MNIELTINKHAFNDVYFPYIYDYSHKFEVYYGGSGSGKSHFVVQKLLIKALSNKRKILVIRKVGNTTKESTWRLTLQLLDEWKLTSYCYINKSDFTIELPNGSILLYKGLDDPEKIKSIVGITDVWCEECTELNVEDFDQLILRVRANVPNLQFFCSFNPVSKVNWVYKRWFAPGIHVPDDTLIVKSTYKDNRFLPSDYGKTIEKYIDTNPQWYKVYVLGEFTSLDKLVYNNWEIKDFDYTKIKGETCIGLDFGFTNDTSALVASIVTDNTIYIFKEWGEKGKVNEEIAAAIKSLGFAKSFIIADSAEPKSVEELKRAGIQRIKESVKGKDSIIHGIQRIQQYKIFVHPRCRGTIEEFENYSWEKDKDTNEYTNEPVDYFNHYMDALRYSMQCMDTGKLRTIDKAVLGL